MKRVSFLVLVGCCVVASACGESEHEEELEVASCDESFVPRCGVDEFGNYARIICRDGVQAFETCPEGSVCSEGVCDCGSIDCCLKTEAGNIKYACDAYSGHEVSEAYRCSEDYDQRYVWKPDYEAQQECFHGCDADSGKCIKMADFEGEACDYGMERACRDGFITSCEYGQLRADTCESGSVCVELDEYGAECMRPCEASELGKEIKSCESVVNEEGENVYYYYLTTQCAQTKDASGNAVYYQEYVDDVECKHSCDENGCTKLHPDEGKPCDEVENTDERCEGNVFVACASNCTNGKCKDSIEATDCGDRLCVEEMIDGMHTASCIENDPCEPSEVNNEKTVKCDYFEDVELVSLYRCEKVGDKYFWRDVMGCYEACEKSQLGQSIGMYCQEGYSTYKVCSEESGVYMWMEMFDHCKDGCDPGTKLCHQASDADECNASEYKKTCDGTKIKGCTAGRIGIIEDCADRSTYYIGENVSGSFVDTCVETENGASCEPSCTKSDMNKSELTCDPVFEMMIGDVCVESKNHTYYWDTLDEPCIHGCNDKGDGCLKLHPDEGNPCDEKFEEKCADNMTLSCSNGVIRADLCEDESVCAVFEKHAQCTIPCSESDVEPLKLECKTYSQGSECVKQGDKYVWHDIREKCIHGCNEDGTCKRLYETEGEYCSSWDKHCEGNMLYECSQYDDDRIHILDCAEEGMTCISSDDSAKCAELCTEEEYEAQATKKACEKGPYYDYSVYKKCEQSYVTADKFEWLVDDSQPELVCENGCNLSTGECNE